MPKPVSNRTLIKVSVPLLKKVQIPTKKHRMKQMLKEFRYCKTCAKGEFLCDKHTE